MVLYDKLYRGSDSVCEMNQENQFFSSYLLRSIQRVASHKQYGIKFFVKKTDRQSSFWIQLGNYSKTIYLHNWRESLYDIQVISLIHLTRLEAQPPHLYSTYTMGSKLVTPPLSSAAWHQPKEGLIHVASYIQLLQIACFLS